jgi:hypothetical protein
MAEKAADDTAVENAYRDIDRYVSETSQSASNGAQLLSPGQRLRVLGTPCDVAVDCRRRLRPSSTRGR